MISYQIQFKKKISTTQRQQWKAGDVVIENTKDIHPAPTGGPYPPQGHVGDITTSGSTPTVWPHWDKNVSEQSEKNEEVWEVVATLPSLKSAINSAKVLIKKYGYDRVQVCRVTKLNIRVEIES